MQSIYWIRWIRCVSLCSALCLAIACAGGGDGPDAGLDSGDDAGAIDGDGAAADDGAADAGADAAADDGGGADAGDGGGAGELGQPCRLDADCRPGLACRGLPGQEVCAVACQSWDGCEGAALPCDDGVCDMNAGACRCPCWNTGCDEGECVDGYCVGCAADAHCEALECPDLPGQDRPRCRLDSQTCVCGGLCGDGVCDEVEASVRSCPADCAQGCTQGEILPVACKNGELVPWCTCSDGRWACEQEPTARCPGETACERAGGSCAAAAEDCYEGQIAADPQGCAGDAPLCCAPVACTAAGEGYYPIVGLCCPGLRALDSAEPISGFVPEIEGVCCFANCWELYCAPCSDGVCQPHLGENCCNCPEDCPPPAYGLVCQADYDCGHAFCRQQGEICHQARPVCEQSRCTWQESDLEGQICDPALNACRAP
ncbi:MAG: hypothetical protein JXR96_28935 [Deltaproteobacteria bacterium]|nr:hypothetical protein [Deltaproteobacteria bacterium]